MCRELKHENIVALEEVLLEDKAIFMVFEYAEHDFLVSAQNNKIVSLQSKKKSNLANYSLSFAYGKKTDPRSHCQVTAVATD